MKMPTPPMSQVSPAVSGGDATLAPHNSYHRLAVASARDAALWGALAGLELISHRVTLRRHGDWAAWVANHCQFSRRTAGRYMVAAQRAVVQMQGGPQFAPSELHPDEWEALKQRLLDVLEDDALGEERAALIASVRAAKPRAALPPRHPDAPRRGRPPLSPEDKAIMFARRFHTQPPAFQRTLFAELRETFAAWLVDSVAPSPA